MTTATTARLDVWPDRFLWASWTYAGSMTHRYAANVIIAGQNQTLVLEAQGQPPVHCSAAVCAVGAARRIDATDTPFLSLNLDPDTPGALQLRRTVRDRSVLPLRDDAAALFGDRISDFLDGKLEPAQSRRMGDDIVRALTEYQDVPPALDARVASVAQRLREEVPTQIDVPTLADAVDLSPDRLMHLFRDELGLSMGNFLLWQKMRRALTMILQDESLTRIAQSCGFSDSSHLTRTFQGFYAVRPSDLRDSSYVQARLADES